MTLIRCNQVQLPIKPRQLLPVSLLYHPDSVVRIPFLSVYDVLGVYTHNSQPPATLWGCHQHPQCGGWRIWGSEKLSGSSQPTGPKSTWADVQTHIWMTLKPTLSPVLWGPLSSTQFSAASRRCTWQWDGARPVFSAPAEQLCDLGKITGPVCALVA